MDEGMRAAKMVAAPAYANNEGNLCVCNVAQATPGAVRTWVYFDFERFGADLREYRLSNGIGLSYKILADTNVSSAAHSRAERGGRSNQRIQTIVRLAVWAGLSVDDYVKRGRG